MELVKLKNLVRKDSPIHYINEYHGNLVYILDGITSESNIEIIIEKTAFGTIQLYLKFQPEQSETLRKYLDNIESFLLSLYKDGYFPE